MKYDVFTLFPDILGSFKEYSIIGRGCDRGIISINPIDIRVYTEDKHKRVDDYPYGGGYGMVMQAEPISNALEATYSNGKMPDKLLYMSAKGRKMDADYCKELSHLDNIALLCGHYEGVDERVLKRNDFEEVSIGDYILTGGEVAAMVLIEAVSRLIDGMLANNEAAFEESIYSGLLEPPSYTRPEIFKGDKVPDILLSGNHAKIEEWKFKNSLELTLQKRPDLLNQFLARSDSLDKRRRKILEEFIMENNLDIDK